MQGHASNSITRIPESLKGLKALELLVIADPHPTTWASLAVEAGRKDDIYILPVATQFECKGSRVASNRSMQWGEQIVKPIFELKDDLEVMYLWRRSSASPTRCSRTSRSRTTCRRRRMCCAR